MNEQPLPATPPPAPQAPQAPMTMPTNLPPNPKKQNPVKIFAIIAVVFGIVFLGGVATIFKISSGVDQEQDFVSFVNESIVGDKALDGAWVDNETRADAAFLEQFNTVRKVIKDGNFKEVSKFKDCATITNPHEYSTQSSRSFCAAALCTPAATAECVYLIAYSGGNAKRISIESFELLMTESEASTRIDTLLAKS
jgi:hypothetical protein